MDTPTDAVIITSKSRIEAIIRAALRADQEELAHPTPPDDDARLFGWVTNKKAMELLGLSRPTLARYRKSGRLAYSKVGSSVYYRLSDLQALMEDNAGG